MGKTAVKNTPQNNTIKDFKILALDKCKCKNQQEFIKRSEEHAKFWKKLEGLGVNKLAAMFSDNKDQKPKHNENIMLEDEKWTSLLSDLSSLIHPKKRN